jgi:hypothetical protein
MEVIVGGLFTREVGKRYVGISDNKGRMHRDQPFVVLREATYEEWKACAEAEGVAIQPGIDALARSGKAKFYGISTD